MIILSVRSLAGQLIVTVAPITHSPPERAEFGVQIPPATKRRLGLDDQPSWIIATDLNQFVWPGVDLRPTAAGEYAYGLLPAGLYQAVRERVLALARARRAMVTPRKE